MSRVRVQIMNQFHRKSHEYKAIKRNAFGFRNFENFKKRIFIALNIKKERTKFVLSPHIFADSPLHLTGF
ncbi:transposase-like protein, IS1167 [Streptococcus pneumoniae]|nr:transposase-like protein, IS1167 [Streptococcus pneumoniae]